MYMPKFNSEEEKEILMKAVKEYNEGKLGINKLAEKYKLGNKLRYYLSKNNLSRPKKRQDIDHSFFKCIDSEEKAYWLGFIFADGNVSDYTKGTHKYCLEITLKSSDKSHLIKFKEAIGYSGDISDRVQGNYKSCRISFSSKELILDLIEHGCTPRKSLTLEFPSSVPDCYMRHFIRGYFDGDGSVNCYHAEGSTRPKINISILGTNMFLSDLQEFLYNVLGLTKNKIYSNKTKGEAMEYKKAWKQAVIFLHYIYDDSTIYLDRKYNFFKDYCRAWGM